MSVTERERERERDRKRELERKMIGLLFVLCTIIYYVNLSPSAERLF